MKSVRLTLQYGPDTVHPMHRFVAEHDAFSSYQLVNWNNAPDDHNVLLFHVVGDRDAYRDRVSDLEEPVTVDVTESAGRTDGDAESFYVYVREDSEELVERLVTAFSRRSLVPIPPLEYRMDWSIRFRLLGESEDIHRALERVPEGIETTVEQVGEYRGNDPAADDLTSRQRESLRVARDLGYFAVPREADLEDVAAELECAPGTASQLLRKAEERVIDGLVL